MSNVLRFDRPRHMAPSEPDYVVVCWPGQVATHQPFASRADALRWVDLEHADCCCDHRVLRAGVLDGQPGREVCGGDYGHTLSEVDVTPSGGKAYECTTCPHQVVIEPDDSRVPVDVYEVTL